MQRVYGVVSEDVVHRIDDIAGQKGLSRAQWIGLAIESVLTHNGTEKSTELDDMRAALDQQGQEIAFLKELLQTKNGEIGHLRELSNLLTQRSSLLCPYQARHLLNRIRSPDGNSGE